MNVWIPSGGLFYFSSFFDLFLKLSVGGWSRDGPRGVILFSRV